MYAEDTLHLVLRLRGGGGGEKATAINTITGEKITFLFYRHETMREIGSKILQSKEICILNVNGTDLIEPDDDKRILEYMDDEFYGDHKIVYAIGLDFRSIIESFNSTGLMSDQLFKYLSVKDIDALRNE